MNPPTAIVAASMPVAKPSGIVKSTGDPGIQTLEIDHGAGNIDGLDPAGQLACLFFFIAVARLVGFPCIAEHETSDHRKDHDKGHAHVQVGTCVAEGGFDLFLDMRAVEHTRFSRDPEDDAELHVHLAVLGPLDRAHQRLGELVAHVACNGNQTGNAEAHHARGKNECPAGTDKAADQTADEPYPEQVQNGHSIKIDEVAHDVLHLILPPSFSWKPQPRVRSRNDP